MFDDIDDLYQQMILDHSRNPRNMRQIMEPDGVANGYNPLCGDRVTVFIKLENDTVTDVTFIGAGCAICTRNRAIFYL